MFKKITLSIIFASLSINSFALSPELIRNGSFSQNKTGWTSTSATDFSLNNEAGNLTANLLNHVEIKQSITTIGTCNLLFSIKSKMKNSNPGNMTITVGNSVLNIPVKTNSWNASRASILFNAKPTQRYNMYILIKGTSSIIDDVSGKCQ